MSTLVYQVVDILHLYGLRLKLKQLMGKAPLLRLNMKLTQKKITLISLLMLLLNGCTSTTVPPPVKIPVAIPSSLLLPCDVEAPPTANEIINALDRYKAVGVTDENEARFLLMTEHWLLQTDALGLCNIQVDKLREWNERQRNLENSHDPRGRSD